MMNKDYIHEEVKKLMKKYQSNNPQQLAKQLGIIVKYEPMGTFDGCCKGFFITHCRKKHITVNADLCENTQRIILVHEIAHAHLHFKANTCAAFHDFVIFENVNTMECEANVFAADYLMDDDAVLDVLTENISFFEAAARLYVPPELLAFKFMLMKRRGYQLLEPPFIANGDFLKNI